jgi:uncharacterized membrane protein
VDDADFERLTARVDALEREVAQLRYGIGTPAAPPPERAPVTQRTVPTAAAAPAAATAATAPVPQRRDVESIVGGRGLLYAGAFLILLGVASFLKIAFDRGWIGPPMRVALGLIAGAALIGIATALRKRLHPIFADAIVGLGAAIAYLSLYASGSMFHLLPLPAVAFGTIAVTAALCVLAYWQNRQPLAFVGIAGGIIAPLLFGGSDDDSLLLYVYLAVLSSASIVLSELRGWRALPIVSLIGSALYWIFLFFDGNVHSFAERLIVAIVLYALFSASMLLAWRKNQPIDAWRITVAALNAIWFFLGIAALAVGHDAILAMVFLAVAAAHLIAGRAMNQRQQYWLATIALSFAIPGICGSFSHLVPAETLSIAMHVAWVVEATLVGVLGARWNDRVMVVLAGTLFATVVLHTIVMYGLDDLKSVLNDRFISLVAAAIGMGIARRELAARGVTSGGFRGFAKVAIDLVVLFAITMEAELIGNLVQPHSNETGGSVAISIAWALYGAALIAFGIRFKDAVSRWDGLILLALAVLKVLVLDLTQFDLVFRVVSALALGVVMLVMAYFYQTRLRAKPGE